MFLFLVLLSLGSPSPTMTDAPRYRAEIEKWRADRVRRLTAEDGWLSVVGLSWLEEGDNSVGSAPSTRVALPAGRTPARLGTIRLSRGSPTFTAAPGVSVTHDGKPVSTIKTWLRRSLLEIRECMGS